MSKIINCGQCNGSGQVKQVEPLSRYDTDPDSDFVRVVGWQVCPFCEGTGLSPAAPSTTMEPGRE